MCDGGGVLAGCIFTALLMVGDETDCLNANWLSSRGFVVAAWMCIVGRLTDMCSGWLDVFLVTVAGG